MPTRRHKPVSVHRKLHPLVRLWVLRFIVPLGGQSELRRSMCMCFFDALEALGVEVPEDREDPTDLILRQLRRMHAAVEGAFEGKRMRARPRLERNIRKLAALLQLDEIEGQILRFAVLLHTENALTRAAGLLGDLGTEDAYRAISDCLRISLRDVRRALRGRGPLSRSGLVSVEKSGGDQLANKLSVLTPAFAERMAEAVDDPLDVIRETVIRAEPATLVFDDYPHAAAMLALARPLMRMAVAERRTATNLLIYGDPGTGKTQLARLLAADAGASAFEVSSEDPDGDAKFGPERLRAYRAGQAFLANAPAVLIFDECQEVFDDGAEGLGTRSTAELRKGWMNRALESNPVPTIWLSNNITSLDPAFLRRFDIVLHLPVPPRSQRLRIAGEACGTLLDDADRARVAESRDLAPAILTRAASVVRAIAPALPASRHSAAVTQLIEASLRARGAPPLPAAGSLPALDLYRPDFTCSDTDLQALVDGVRTSGAARICLFGPPGTGKTAFGQWLARELDMPLTTKRASDLLGPFVGQTEMQLAEAFREAEADNAVLLIDEVDSFLRDRRKGERSWEITQVNEMLTQMERFSGVLIASTNLMDGIDQAALRRFDLKVRFDYLRPAQAAALFEEWCARLGLAGSGPRCCAELGRLENLTPGDFAAVARRHRFHPLEDAPAMVRALQAECGLKERGGRRAIGFT